MKVWAAVTMPIVPRTADTCPNRARFALTVSKNVPTLGVWEDCADMTARAGRSASTSTCRSAPPAAGTATSTPTPPPSWAARTPTAGWRRCAPSWVWPPHARGHAARVETVFVGGGTPSLLGGAGLGGGARRGARALHAGRTMPRSPPRPTRSRRRRSCSTELRAAGYTRVSLGMQSAAPHVLAVLDRVHSPGRAPPPRPRSPRRGVRARQPRPHLRHAGGDRRRPAALGRRRDGGRRRPRIRVRAGRRGRHRAGPAGAPRRDRGTRRRRARPALRAARRAAVRRPGSTGTRCPTGAGPAASAGTISATGTAASGGAPDRVRTAIVGGDPVVERQAPQRLCAVIGRRDVAGRRLRGARRRRAAHRGRDAAAAVARRAAAGRARRRRT